MLEDFVAYQEKIENRDKKINELKEEIKQLEKNIEANNRIFMRKNQKNSKPAKKNMFLFNSNRPGNKNINKKQDIIINNKNLKTSERKKAKSTQKINTNLSTNKYNYYIINSETKKFNFNIFAKREKTLDFKNSKINLNNIYNNTDVNEKLFKEKFVTNINSNIKQIKITNESFNKNEKKKIGHIKTEINPSNNLYNNYIENFKKKKENIFVNKNLTNNFNQNNYNNKININKVLPTKIKVEHFVKDEKNKLKNENVDMYKNIENYIESVFNQYFFYYKNNMNVSCNKENKK